MQDVKVDMTEMEEGLFKSHKTVKRLAMNRLDYKVYRGWTLPDDENGEDEGYLVEYTDGGKTNDPRHEGYISWSPKAQFDNGYKKITSCYKQRVIDEKHVLDVKAKALSEFIGNNPLFDDIDPEEQERMKEQNDIMWQYSEILGKRIDAF